MMKHRGNGGNGSDWQWSSGRNYRNWSWEESVGVGRIGPSLQRLYHSISFYMYCIYIYNISSNICNDLFYHNSLTSMTQYDYMTVFSNIIAGVDQGFSMLKCHPEGLSLWSVPAVPLFGCKDVQTLRGEGYSRMHDDNIGFSHMHMAWRVCIHEIMTQHARNWILQVVTSIL